MLRLLILILICQSGLAAVDLKPIKHRKLKITASPIGEKTVSDISGAHFFITKDNGASWKAVEAARIVHETGKAPYFVFEADGDGTYGFWIQRHYSDGSSEAKPQAGTEPAAKSMKLIDTTAPRIDKFLSGLLAGTEKKLFLEWSVTDQHLSDKPVSFELSTDLKSWSSFLGNMDKEQGQIIPLPQAEPFYVRLVATDSAGNAATSKVILIGSKPEVAAAVKTDDNSANKTNAAEAGTASLPSIAEVEKDVDAELAKKEAAAPRPVVPPGHKDIVAPYADKPWPGKYTGEKEAETKTSVLATDDAGNPIPAPVKKEKIIAEDIALILKKRKGRILFGKDAEKVLAAAREAARNSYYDRALLLYRRLKDGTMAAEALPEEIEILIKINDLKQAMELVRTAPPEVMNTALRIQEANLWIAKNKLKLAISVLDGIIPDKTDDYKNARLLLARCHIQADHLRSAKTILHQLAQHDDSWGQLAKALLDQLAND